MTTYSSFFGYAMPQAVAALDEFRPVSVYRAEMTRNNLGHMLDQFTQHRINFMAVDDTDSFVPPSEVQRVWHQEFLLTWLREDRPVNIDLRVAVTAPGSGIVRARVVPAKFAVGDSAADDLSLIDATATSVGSTPSWVIDVQTDFGADGIPDGFGGAAWDSTIPVSEGEVTLVTVSRMRLEVFLGVDDVDSPQHKLRGVLLREFAG